MFRRRVRRVLAAIATRKTSAEGLPSGGRGVEVDHSADEARFLLIGLSAALRVLLVVHSEQADGEVLRVISARRATRSERAQYDARWKR